MSSMLTSLTANSFRYLAAAVLILILALFLRIAPLPAESVDGDEMFSRRVALAGPAEAWTMVRKDLVHPPLYYFLLKATMPGGADSTANGIRALSLAAGVATIAAIILLGFAESALRLPGLLAALLLALNKTHIYYSQQARSYALYCLLVTLLLLWSALARRYRGKSWFWIGGFLLMAAIIWTHYVGALFCAMCVVPMAFPVGAVSPGARARILPLACLALAGLSFLPWLIPEISVYRHKAGLSTNLEWQGLPALYDLKMVYAEFAGIPDFLGSTTVSLLLVASLIGCALFLRPDPQASVDQSTISTFALTAMAPPAVLWLLTRWPFHLPIFGVRHLLPAFVPALVMIGLGLSKLASRAKDAIGPGLLFAPGAAFLCAFQIAPVCRTWPGPVRQPYSQIAADLQRPGLDLPVYTTWPYGIGASVQFYLPAGRKIRRLEVSGPAPDLLPRLIVLYRPAVPRESEMIRIICRDYEVISQKYYYGAISAKFGTRLLVLAKP